MTMPDGSSPTDTGLVQLGHYRIVERIGRGAMGVVYAARDETMGREVALKVMMPDLESEPETRARFFREAQVAAKLAHRNVVTIFDMGEENGRLYIVMERLRGSTLTDLLKERPRLDLEEKLDLMGQVCEGLAVAGAAGVCHRDIKPSNLFVQHDGSLKVLDFGIARLASSTMTASGFIVGTPDYMSPEQARGTEVDERSDIFSAGAVFYFLLCGRKPFEARELPAVLHKVIVEDPLPLRPDEAPPELAQIVTRMLAKAPEQRIQTFRLVHAELLRFARRFDSDTRSVATGAFGRFESLEALGAEYAGLTGVLGLADADAVEACRSDVLTLHPAFEDRGVVALKSVPLRRSVIERAAASIDSASAALRERVVAARCAVQALEASRANPSDPAAALRALDQAADLVPDSPVIAAARGQCRAQLTERQVLEEQFDLLLHQAERAWHAGDVEVAQKLLSTAEALAPGDRQLLGRSSELRNQIVADMEEQRRRCAECLGQARRALERGDFEGAERHLAEARGVDRNAQSIPEVRTAIDEAQARARAAEALEQDARALIEQASADFARGDWDTAIAALTEFSAAHPEEPAVARERQRLEAERERRQREARRRAEVDGLVTRATILYDRGDLTGAFAAAEAVRQIDGSDERARALLASVRARRRQIEEAATRSGRVDAHLQRARALLDTRHFQKALAEARKASALDPARADVALTTGDIMRAQEADAIAKAREAAAAERARAVRPLVDAASAALAAGDLARAQWSAENARTLDPDNPLVTALATRIQEALAAAPPAGDDDDTVDLGMGEVEPAANGGAPSYGTALREGLGSARERAARLLQRFRSARGQTTTEWLMIAGLLTAMVMVGLRYLPSLLRDVVVSISWGIRTIAP